MKKGWELKKLVELTSHLGDGLHGTPKYTLNGEYYFINGNNLNNGIIEYKENTKTVSFEEYNKYKKNLSDRTVLVSINGTLGNVAFYNYEKVILGKSACYFNLKPGVDKNFIKYILSSPYFLNYANKEATGATIKNVSLKTMREFEIPLPSLTEQQRIVAILDESFTAISKAKANAEQNLKNAKGLFESYLQGEFENKGGGWEEKRLGDVCEYDKTQNKETNLPYIGLEDIESNSGKLIGPLTPRIVKSITFSFNQKHVLYGRLRPYLNKVFLPDFEGHCSTEIFPIKPIESDLDRSFLYRWLIAKETMNKINSTWTGATLPRANMNAVLEFKINLPSIELQKVIVQKFDILSAEIKKLESIYQKKITDLEELKKSILQKAFSGELKTTKALLV